MFRAMKQLALAMALVLAAACGGPSRTTFARPPGGAVVFDRASAKPEALEIADKVLAAHGGAQAWEAAKQIRWRQTIIVDGKPGTSVEQAWDRWNARHWASLDREKGGAFAVMYEIYGNYAAGYIVGREKGGKEVVGSGEAAEGVKVARKAWQRDSTVTLAPFLMYEPGAKLEYMGMVKDGDLELHEIKVTFAAEDTARKGIELHIYADKDKFLVQRVMVTTPEGDRIGYSLGAYQAFGGLQIATERKNLGTGETVKVSDVQVGAPDDDLFVAPVS
jgi:hypothetical protein